MRSKSILSCSLTLAAALLLLLCVRAAPDCAPCDPALCATPPASGCAAGSVLDACGCCALCLAAEGERCAAGRGGRSAGAQRCGSGLECVRADKKSKVGVCACKGQDQVCGTDGVTYAHACALKSADARARREGQAEVSVRNKGRCATGPVIVSPPARVFNVSGAQVFLSCEAVGVPTPVLTWRKVIGGRKKFALLPGDRDNLAVQTRGGPEKHQVTGWVLISPLTKDEAGSYECHAANAKGDASAVGEIRLVTDIQDVKVEPVDDVAVADDVIVGDVPVKKVTKDEEL
ncbi:LOW QUALITY PROTEIN: insulin-like growth factor-binding protein 7 [Phycodurus eques]|uniref:LOW QUALITY PROTEIN: insulin-like growth factor-binding protein 7 n=1 Tax=Phycodurus eques TaxID=693459 RepID=UPI002ACE255E|nr:LOW QUALITY PROTEIN: insulin-like growth factor-binding protein 7 [Phycodurus eques]